MVFFFYFSCRFLYLNWFQIWILIFVCNVRIRSKKPPGTFCFINFNDLSLFEWIVLGLGRFSQSLGQFFLTVGSNNFGNKIPFFSNHMLGRLDIILSCHHWLKSNLLCLVYLNLNFRKVQIFWEDHKNWKNISQLFFEFKVKWNGEIFSSSCVLFRLSEL